MIIVKPSEQQLSKYVGFLRGGNTGYVNTSGESATDSSSSCFRMILLRHHKVETPIDFRSRVTFAVGHAIENAFEEQYLKGKFQYEKEFFLIEEITEDVACKLAVDFFLTEDSIPIELKSVSSTNSYEKVFQKDTPKMENVIQLVNYLISLEVTHGILYYINTLYHNHKGTKNSYKAAAGDIKKFSIDIDDNFDILINGQSSNISAKQVLAFRDKAAHLIRSNEIEKSRPVGDVFSPCSLCAFKEVCDDYDANNYTTNDFIEKCKQVIKEEK